MAADPAQGSGPADVAGLRGWLARRLYQRLGLLLHETASHAILLGIALSSGLGFGGALLLLVADLLLVILLSMPVHREHSAPKYLLGLLMTAGLLGFLMLMTLFAYGIAIENQAPALGAALLGPLLPLNVETLKWLIGLSAAHLLLMFGYVWTQPEPRRAWDRLTFLGAGATLLSLFVLMFVIGIAGDSAIAIARWFVPELQPDAVLTAMLVGLRLLFTALMAIAPDSIWEQEHRLRQG
jgi:hypothetical protein